MRALHVDKLLLVPRINQSVTNSLDHQKFQVCEKTVQFSPELKEMDQLLIQIT
jgi:hypothetical protein